MQKKRAQKYSRRAMNKPRTFLDSSVIIAALLSLQGGSSYLLREHHDDFTFQINEYVLAEIQEVLESKLSSQVPQSVDLFLLLGVAEVQTISNPSKQELRSVIRLISRKDAPVLVSAMNESDYLLTLDNEFFKPDVIYAAKERELVILKPRDLIQMLN